MSLATRRWAYGLGVAFVGGCAVSIEAGLALIVVDPHDFNLGPGLQHMLAVVATVGLLAGLKCAFFYLRQAPLPGWDGMDRRGGDGK